MYNRYIPQPDGSYRRNRVQEQQRVLLRAPQQVQPLRELLQREQLHFPLLLLRLLDKIYRLP